ncbi:MAG: fused MFS/spermidine synthase [Chloroflexi bacterium]|nr:fused MFS/spermidine synthase [Chloroflexota bacterium]
MLRSNNIWTASFVVFVSSACTLVLELVAGRIMAPYVGVSLYTWTSIIGVVLAGISVGNYLGGKVADRWASHTTLGILLLLSGLASLSVLLMINFLVNGLPFTLPLVAKILALTTIVFFAPSCIMGTISPLVVKLVLQRLEETGNIVGKIYAFSALGSIVGTFLTGFILIELVGTRVIVAIIGVVLLLMAAVFGDWRKAKVEGAILVLLFAAFGGYLYQEQKMESPFLKETNYYSIRVNEKVREDNTVIKELVLDHLIHSFNNMTDPTQLEYGYEKIYAEVTKYLTRTKRTLNTLSIGGGGYTFPRYIELVYPGSVVEVVEIDPGVTEVAYAHLGLPQDTTIKTFTEDARMFFERNSFGQKYDLVMGDAFNDLSLPYHLTTLEFNEKVKKALQPDGFYMVNVIDSYKKGEFMRAYINTLKLTFPYVYLFGLGTSWEWEGSSTYIVLAGASALDLEDYRQFVTSNGRSYPSDTIMPDEQLSEYLRSGRQIILTDDYAPVDNLMAPRFVERGY